MRRAWRGKVKEGLIFGIASYDLIPISLQLIEPSDNQVASDLGRVCSMNPDLSKALQRRKDTWR